MTELTQERLKHLLDYDPITGVFRRRIKVGGQLAGSIAGVIDADGYRVIRVDGVKRKAHRLAFLWMTGLIPSGRVDHENTIRDDNAWPNLREATHSENCANSAGKRGKKFPVKGVYPRDGRYRAVICKNGRNCYLGTFDTVDAAQGAYAEAAKQMFGKFARVA